MCAFLWTLENARGGGGKRREKGKKGRGRRAEGASESISADDTTPTPNYLKYTGDATFSDIYN